MLAYLVDRWLVLAGSGHLLFDLNQAEQGFFRVVALYLDMPLDRLLLDERTRAWFLKNTQGVGNQAHGTLVLASLMQLLLAKAGLEMGALSLRAVSLAASTATLGLWMGILWRRTGGLLAPIAFLALFIAAPPVLLKLSLVHWGTHELVMLLFSVWMALFAGWIDRPARGAGAVVRVGLAAGLGALFVLMGHSLLMPVLATVLWLGMAATRGGRRPLQGLLGLLLGVGAFVLVLHLVRSSGWLTGLGHPGSAFEGPLLPGKQDAPFLISQERSLLGVRLWSEEIAARAMPMVPGSAYGRHAAWIEPLVRAGTGLVGLGLALGAVFERRLRLGAFLGLYLVLGWLGVTVLGQLVGLDPGILSGIQPRYYAHLYLVALAVLALWGTRRAWRLPLLGLVLFFGLWEHRTLFDWEQPVTVESAPFSRCDGTRLWLQDHSDRSPPADRLALGAASPAFLRGMGIIERWQFRDYWRWYQPADVQEGLAASKLRQHIGMQPERPRDPEFWQGLGYGLGCLVPAPRREGLGPVLDSLSPEERAEVESGLLLPRFSLSGR